MDKKKLDAEFALHEFSVRYRAALAKQCAVTEKTIWGIRDAVRQQHLQEQQPHHGIEAPTIESPKIEPAQRNDSGIEAPKIQEPKIEAPKIGPSKNPRGPEIEPEI
jgi:hypothetical protein